MAVDGDTRTDWYDRTCSCTNKEADPWWQIDLDESYQIAAVRVTNRNEHPDRLNNFVVSVDGTQCAQGGKPGTSETMTVKCEATGSKVKIQTHPSPDTYLTLCEVGIQAAKKGR